MRRRAVYSHVQATMNAASAYISEFGCAQYYIQISVADGLSVKCIAKPTGPTREDFLQSIQRIWMRRSTGQLGNFRVCTAPVHLRRDGKATSVFSALTSWMLWNPGVQGAIWTSAELASNLSGSDYRCRVIVQDSCKVNEAYWAHLVRQYKWWHDLLLNKGVESGHLFSESLLLVRCWFHTFNVDRQAMIVYGCPRLWSSIVRFTHLWTNGHFRSRLLMCVQKLYLDVDFVEVPCFPPQV